MTTKRKHTLVQEPEVAKEEATKLAADTLDASKIKTEADFLAFIRYRRASPAVNRTQAQIAKALDYSSGEYYGLIESGKRKIDPEKVPMLADQLVVDRKAFTRLYLKIAMPNLYFTFWGEEELHLASPDKQKHFVRISETDIELLNKLNRMPSPERKSIVNMVELLSAKH